MPPLVLHIIPMSPPCRAAEFGIKILGLEAEIKHVPYTPFKLGLEGGHREESYLKLNPQHTVPTLQDGDFSVWHSQNILQYLVDKYRPGHSLYPKDIETRTKIHQYLYFESSTLFKNARLLVEPFIYYNGKYEAVREEPCRRGLELLEATIDPKSKLLVGDELTIADICVLMSTQATFCFLQVKKGEYPKIDAWKERAEKAFPFFEQFDQENKTFEPMYHPLAEAAGRV